MDDRFKPIANCLSSSLLRGALAAAITTSGSAVTVAQGTHELRPQRLPAVSAVPSSLRGESRETGGSHLATSQLGLPRRGDGMQGRRGDGMQGRERLASMVSSDILGQTPGAVRHHPPEPLAESVTLLRLQRRGDQLTLDAERSLRRGAIRSAREAAIDALRSFAAAADLQSGQRDAGQALEQATTAVREAGDLVGRYGHVGAAELQRMVRSHQTPVLHGCRLDTLTPYAAADIYLDFARASFTRAAAGRREAAATLLLLARAELENRELHGALVDSVSLTCLRAAVGVDPHSAVATNELGYRAMRLGLLDEAQWALERSLAIQPNEPAVRNLIETHRLAGNLQTARMLVARLPQFGGELAASGPEVLRVEPQEFAAISPPVQPAAAGQTPPSASHPEPHRPLNSDGTGNLSPGARDGGPQEHDSGAAGDGSVSVLERVANSMRTLWK